MASFLTLLEADHAVRKEPLVAIKKRLEAFPWVVKMPTNVAQARQGYAACAWLTDNLDNNNVDFLAMRVQMDRLVLLQLMGLDVRGNITDQCDRVAAHLRTFARPTAFCGIMQLADPAEFARMCALDNQAQLARLAETSIPPPPPGDGQNEMRDRLSMAWWLLNKCFSGEDVQALTPAAQNKIYDCLAIHAAWPREVKHAALQALLTSWHTNIDQARRLAGAQAAGAQAAGANQDGGSGAGAPGGGAHGAGCGMSPGRNAGGAWGSPGAAGCGGFGGAHGHGFSGAVPPGGIWDLGGVAGQLDFGDVTLVAKTAEDLARDNSLRALGQINASGWHTGMSAGGLSCWWGGAPAVVTPGKAMQPPQLNILGSAQLGFGGVGESAMAEVMKRGVGSVAQEAMARSARPRGAGYRDAELNEIVGLLNALRGQLQDLPSIMTSAQNTKLRDARKNEPPDNRTAVAPYACWPWLQPLMKPVNEPFDMRTIGTILRIANICDWDQATDYASQTRRATRLAELRVLSMEFATAKGDGDLTALLLLTDKVKAYLARQFNMMRDMALADYQRYPMVDQLREQAAGRYLQCSQIQVLLAEVARILEDGAKQLASDARNRFIAGNWSLLWDAFFLQGAMPADLMQVVLSQGAVFGLAAIEVEAPAAIQIGGTSSGGGGGGSGGSDGGSVGGGGSFSFSTARGSGGTPGGSGSLSGGGSTPRSGGRSRRSSLGRFLPFSATVVGKTLGTSSVSGSCWGCSEQGHAQIECPKLWADSGRQLPGFSKNGKRLKDKWKDGDPTRATYKEWVAFITDTDNFPDGQGKTRFPEAPTLEHFKERARKAPP